MNNNASDASNCFPYRTVPHGKGSIEYYPDGRVKYHSPNNNGMLERSSIFT